MKKFMLDQQPNKRDQEREREKEGDVGNRGKPQPPKI
jgi:hypothetical protein